MSKVKEKVMEKKKKEGMGEMEKDKEGEKGISLNVMRSPCLPEGSCRTLIFPYRFGGHQ